MGGVGVSRQHELVGLGVRLFCPSTVSALVFPVILGVSLQDLVTPFQNGCAHDGSSVQAIVSISRHAPRRPLAQAPTILVGSASPARPHNHARPRPREATLQPCWGAGGDQNAGRAPGGPFWARATGQGVPMTHPGFPRHGLRLRPALLFFAACLRGTSDQAARSRDTPGVPTTRSFLLVRHGESVGTCWGRSTPPLLITSRAPTRRSCRGRRPCAVSACVAGSPTRLLGCPPTGPLLGTRPVPG